MRFLYMFCYHGAFVIFFVLASGIDGHIDGSQRKRDLHGTRLFLRAWAEEDAIQYISDDDFANVRPGNDETRELKQSDVLPAVLPLSLHTEDGTRFSGLLLQRNHRIEHNMTISYGSMTENSPLKPENSAQYSDSLSGSAFGMRQTDGNYRYDGLVHVDGERYEIHPDTDDVVTKNLRPRGFENHIAHLMTRSENMGPVDQKMHANIERLIENKKRIDTRNDGTDYHVEMAFVVDYAEYIKWKKETGSEKGAIDAIKYKYSYVYNGMERAAKTITQAEDGMSLRLWIKHFKIVTEETLSAASQFTPGLDPNTPKSQWMYSEKFLTYLSETWGPQNGLTVPEDYDTLMYIVPYRLMWTYPDGKLGEVIGFSSDFCMCKKLCHSVVVDHGFETWSTGIHELGHNLGDPDHDTDNDGECSSWKMYIMTIHWLRPYNARFSPCTLRKIKKHLSTATCLHNRGSNHDLVKVTKLPGESYDRDWQCRWYWSKGNFKWHYGRYMENMEMENIKFCRKSAKESDCYGGLPCGGALTSKNGQKSCYCYRKTMLPADGTICGDNKWCIQGKCVKKT